MADDPTPPAPSESSKARTLQELLPLAVGASLLSAALHASSIALNMANGFGAGFTLADGLALSAILPQIVVAAALYELGEHTKHKAVGMAGTGLYLFGWLLQILILCQEDFMPTWAQIVVGIVVVLGFVGAMGMLAENAPRGVKELSWAIPFLCYILLRVVGRILARKLGIDFGTTFVLFAGAVLLLGLVCFTLWYGIVLVLRHERFGILGVLVGAAHVAALGYFAVAMTQMITTGLALLEQPGMNEQLFGQEIEKAAVGLLSSALIYETVPAVLTALWFLALRSRLRFGEPEGGSEPPAGDPVTA